MDLEELSMIGPIVDLASVDSIHRKRITAFVNHFIIQTASFLNRFAHNAENKLYQVNDRLQKLEASLILLESKLSSIPGLDVTNKIGDRTLPDAVEPVDTPLDTIDLPEIDEIRKEDETLHETPKEIESPKLDESLVKYVKMLQFGVPIPAVKLKMQQDDISIENQNLVINH